MDGLAGRIVVHVSVDVPRPRRLQHLGRRLRHVLQLGLFVGAPGAADPERRDAPFVLEFGIDGDPVVGIGEALAEAVETHAPPTRLQQFRLELRAESGLCSSAPPIVSPCTALKAVSPQEALVLVLHVAEPGHVHPIGPAAERGLVEEAIDPAPRRAAHGVVHEVAAQLAARVGQAVGILGAGGVEQQPGALERRSTEEHQPPLDLELLTGIAIDDAHTARTPGGGVVQHLGHDAVGPHREPAGLPRRRQGAADAVEVGMGDTAALTGAAVVARCPAVVHLGKDRGAPDGEHAIAPPGPLQCIADVLLDAVEFHRGEELSVRQLRQPLGIAGDADEPLDVIVPWLDVGVADGPVDPVSILEVGLEVEVAPAVHLPAPHDRAPAHLPSPQPVERLAFIGAVGVLEIVDEELGAVLVAGVAAPLDRLFPFHPGPVAPAPELHLPRLHVLHVIPAGDDVPSRLQHYRAEPLLAELLGGPAAADPRPDDDGVVLLAPAHQAGLCAGLVMSSHPP